MGRRTILLLLALLLLAACGRVQNPRFAGEDGGAGDVEVEAAIPEPLLLGSPAEITFRVAEAGQPVSGARVEVEGNMTHAGMEPVLVEASEQAPGEYAAELDWTMSGEWFVTVRVTLPGGERVERTFDALEVGLP